METIQEEDRAMNENPVPAIVDCHNDLLLELNYRRAEPNPFARHWLDKLIAGGVKLQVCPIYTAGLETLPELALRQGLEQVMAFNRAVRENADRVIAVRTRADLAAVEAGDRLGLLLSMEGAEALGYDPEMVDIFWELGVRMFSLTHNRRNPFADGAAEPAHNGISRLGGLLVDRLVAHGAILDLVHASDRTFADVLERSGDAACVVSHSACRGIISTQRNLSDEQMRALAARGGVLGLMLLPLVIDPEQPTVARVIDHLDHAVAVMGIEHVGLGADFIRQVFRSCATRTPPDALLPAGMSMDAAVDEIAGPEDYPRLVAAMRERGYTGERLDAVLGGNFLRLFRRALPA
jgi:membrane dipeptidase